MLKELPCAIASALAVIAILNPIWTAIGDALHKLGGAF